MARKINIDRLKKKWLKIFYPSAHKYLPCIELSEHVWITDPVYPRGTECQVQIKDLVPGIYTPVIQYDKRGGIKSMLVYMDGNYSNPLREPMRNLRILPLSIGVDSCQCGIFCNSIYPKGKSTGEYGDTGFYNDCCNATGGKGFNDSNKAYDYIKLIESAIELIEKKTSQEIENKMKELEILFNTGAPNYQAGTIQDKGVVSNTGKLNKIHSVYLHKNKDMILILYI